MYRVQQKEPDPSSELHQLEMYFTNLGRSNFNILKRLK